MNEHYHSHPPCFSRSSNAFSTALYDFENALKTWEESLKGDNTVLDSLRKLHVTLKTLLPILENVYRKIT